jgi:DNA-binding PadR family transcriptional regulator
MKSEPVPGAAAKGGIPPLPRNFLRHCLMMLLSDDAAYGYELHSRLRPFALERDRGRVYRTLRDLEAEGLVSSAWRGSDIGPDRHMYELTPQGAEALHNAAQGLQASLLLIERFLDLYRVRESGIHWLRHHPTT